MAKKPLKWTRNPSHRAINMHKWVVWKHIHVLLLAGIAAQLVNQLAGQIQLRFQYLRICIIICSNLLNNSPNQQSLIQLNQLSIQVVQLNVSQYKVVFERMAYLHDSQFTEPDLILSLDSGSFCNMVKNHVASEIVAKIQYRGSKANQINTK